MMHARISLGISISFDGSAFDGIDVGTELLSLRFRAWHVLSRSVGNIPAISFVILGSALSVLVTGYETYSRSRDASIVSLDRKLDADLKFMRKQRNFWVALLLLVLWMYAS
jgi:hypothetical protein